MTFLVDVTGSPVELDDDAKAMEILLSLQAQWALVKGAVNDSDIRNIPDLLNRADDISEAAESALTELGINTFDLSALSRKLRAFWEEGLDQRVKLLLTPLTDISLHDDVTEDGVVLWQVLDWGNSHSGDSFDGQLSFVLSGGASASIELEANDRLDSGKSSFDEDDYLLRVEFKGNVNAGLDGNAERGPLAIGWQGRGSSDHALAFWYDVPVAERHKLFAEVVASCLPTLPSPFDVAAVDSAMRQGGLERLVLSSNINLSSDFKMEFKVSQLNVPYVEAGSFTFNAIASRERECELEFLSLGESRGVRVNLTRASLSTKATASKLTLGFDMSEVVEQLKQYLGDAQDAYTALMNEYEQYLTPGTFLKNQAEVLFNDLAAQLAEELGQHRETLKGVLEKELNGLSDLLGQSSVEAGQRLTQRLNKSLGGLMDASQVQQLETKLATELQAIINDLNADLKSRVEEKQAAGKAAVTAQVEEYKLRFNALAAPYADDWNEAAAGIRGAVLSVGAMIRKLQTALEKAADTRLNLRLLHEESEQRKEDIDLTVDFAEVNADAQETFAILMSGDLGRLIDEIEAGRVSGQYSDSLERMRKSQLEIGFLGVNFSETNLFNSDVEFQVDTDGNVSVGAKLSVSHELRSSWSSQSVGYMSHFNLWAARESGSGSLGVSVTQKDKNLKVSELEDILEELVKLDLIRGEVRTAAVAELTARSTVGAPAATVELRIPLDQDAIEELLDKHNQRDVTVYIDEVSKSLEKAEVFEEGTFEAAGRHVLRIRKYRRHRGNPPAFAFQVFQPMPQDRVTARRKWERFAAQQFAQTQVPSRNWHPVSNSSHQKIRQAVKIHHLVKGYWVLLTKMDEISRYSIQRPEGDAAVHRMQNEIKALHEEMAFCLKPWVKASREFLGHPKDDVSKETLALFKQLATDAGLGDDDGVVSLVLRFADEEDPVMFM